MLSRNAASSRAIPTSKLIQQVKDNPFFPAQWGSNRKGMVSGSEIQDSKKASSFWLEARDKAVFIAEALSGLNVHKQHVNRILEPFLWTTVIISATDWSNFINLRTQLDAQPEFRAVALLIKDALENSLPVMLKPDEWHLPYVSQEERDRLGAFTAASVAAARCARVSYLTHDGQRDTSRDIELADKLLSNGHMSPFEHPAMCLHVPAQWGNFTGFKQYRKFIPNESDPKGR